MGKKAFIHESDKLSPDSHKSICDFESEKFKMTLTYSDPPVGDVIAPPPALFSVSENGPDAFVR